MTFADLYPLFPVVLAIHNVEEYCRYNEFVHAYHSQLPTKLITRGILRDAAILLTLAVTLLAALIYIYRNAVLITLGKVAIFALMVNGLGHCVVSFKQGRLTPGMLSAVILVLPYSVLAIAAMRANFEDSFWTLFRYAAFGTILGPLAILFFLSISYAASLLTFSSRS